MQISMSYLERKLLITDQIRGINEENLIDDMIFILP